jgi:hypothetical protein
MVACGQHVEGGEGRSRREWEMSGHMHVSEWDRPIATDGEACKLQRNILSNIGDHETENYFHPHGARKFSVNV